MNKANFHLFAYQAAFGGAQVLQPLTPVQDPLLTVLSNGFTVPAKSELMWGYAGGAHLTRAQINTPSFRYVGQPDLAPLNITAAVPSPPNTWKPRGPSLVIPRVDSLQALVSVSAADTPAVLMILRQQGSHNPVPGGTVYRLHGTTAIAAVVSAWTLGAITLDTGLPQGLYSLVGLRVVSTTGTGLLAARLAFPGASWRPGFLCQDGFGSIPDDTGTDWTLGEYGQFENVNLPNLEVLGALGTNSTGQDVWIDVIRLGDAPQG